MYSYQKQSKSFLNLGLALLVGGTIGLTGCGGGGGGGGVDVTELSYSGVTTEATINSTSAKALAETSAEASIQAVTDSEGGAVNPFGVVVTDANLSGMRSRVVEVAKQLLKNRKVIEFPVGATITFNDILGAGSSCGGSITVPDNYRTASSGTMTFNNACLTEPGYGTFIFNGSIKFSGTGDPDGYGAGTETSTFINLTIQYDLGSNGSGSYGPMNYTESCSWDDGGYFNNMTCSETNYYTGSGGEVYQVQDADVYGSNDSGWYVSATVYHPTYGYVDVTATGLTFDCANGHPDSGSIEAYGSGGTSISVNFTDCDNYSGSYNDGSGAVSIYGW